MRTRYKNRRKTIENIFGHLYEFESMGNRLACSYCDDVRDGLDHIPPINVVAEYGSKTIRENKIRFIKIPVCKSCNSMLGAKPLFTYAERLSYIYGKLSEKIERKEGIWTHDEIEENLKGNLKRMVKARHNSFVRDVLQRFRNVEEKLVMLGSEGEDAL